MLTCHPPFALTPRLVPPELTRLAFPLVHPPIRAVLMPFAFDDGFFDGIGSSLPDCSMGLLNRACDWLARHPETRDVPAEMLAKFSSDLGQAVPPLLSARIAVRAKKGGIRFPEGRGVTITFAAPAARLAVPAAPSAHRTALYRLPALKEELRARDGDQCRYCAKGLRWGAGQAADSGTWDWLEPDGPASAENVVAACKACGDAKAGRSLKDTGMTLLPPPEPEKRHNACDASEQGKRTRDASRDASKRHRDASPGKPQAGSVTAKGPDLDQDLGLNKDQSLETDQSKSDARARGEAALIADVTDVACAEHGFTPGADQVRSVIAVVDERIRTRKAGERIRTRRGYILQAAKDPRLWEAARRAAAPEPAQGAEAKAQDAPPETPAGATRSPWIPAERCEYQAGRNYECRKCKRQQSHPVHAMPGEKAG